MVRTVITPKQQNISIHVPKDFVGKQVEVIAFTIDDTIEKSLTADKHLPYLASEKSLAEDWLSKEDTRWDNLL